MKYLITAAIAALSALTSVSAHGYVEKVTIGSTEYTGYLPYSDPYTSPAPQRIIRKIPGNGPVEDVYSIDVQCNGWSAGGSAYVGSAPAALVAPVTAGQQIKLKWTAWPDTHKGPLITYMAKVPAGQNITSWNPGSSAVWFKVHQAGLDLATNKWAALKLIDDGNVYTFTVPSTLAPGQYLIRHEIISLHNSWVYPGAQIYPSCIQVVVSGSGTKTPTSLVSFPGAYQSNTPGLVWSIWNPQDTTGVAYPIPGPAVASF
ncbi:Esterase/lipase/thioesterase [Tulasnella sp. 419]|nr:Esterase/lipase/thioesterase [Tulasnella sp. 418]KAG8967502.1 Esterase/lipase/thioesterase [Tulasnella sp. 419]